MTLKGKTVTDSKVFTSGVLHTSNTEDGCFLLLSTGDGEWHQMSGSCYTTIIDLGKGWYILTDYWLGTADLKTEIPFKVVYANPAPNVQ